MIAKVIARVIAMCTNDNNVSLYLLRARKSYAEIIRDGEGEARR